MAAIALMSGVNVLPQNIVYSVPGKSKWCLSDAVLQVATTVGGSFANAAATTTGVLLPGGSFVRCATGTTTCVISNQ
jgi:hypothetical protein